MSENVPRGSFDQAPGEIPVAEQFAATELFDAIISDAMLAHLDPRNDRDYPAKTNLPGDVIHLRTIVSDEEFVEDFTSVVVGSIDAEEFSYRGIQITWETGAHARLLSLYYVDAKAGVVRHAQRDPRNMPFVQRRIEEILQIALISGTFEERLAAARKKVLEESEFTPELRDEIYPPGKPVGLAEMEWVGEVVRSGTPHPSSYGPPKPSV